MHSTWLSSSRSPFRTNTAFFDIGLNTKILIDIKLHQFPAHPSHFLIFSNFLIFSPYFYITSFAKSWIMRFSSSIFIFYIAFLSGLIFFELISFPFSSSFNSILYLSAYRSIRFNQTNAANTYLIYVLNIFCIISSKLNLESPFYSIINGERTFSILLIINTSILRVLRVISNFN